MIVKRCGAMTEYTDAFIDWLDQTPEFKALYKNLQAENASGGHGSDKDDKNRKELFDRYQKFYRGEMSEIDFNNKIDYMLEWFADADHEEPTKFKNELHQWIITQAAFQRLLKAQKPTTALTKVEEKSTKPDEVQLYHDYKDTYKDSITERQFHLWINEMMRRHKSPDQLIQYGMGNLDWIEKQPEFRKLLQEYLRSKPTDTKKKKWISIFKKSRII